MKTLKNFAKRKEPGSLSYLPSSRTAFVRMMTSKSALSWALMLSVGFGLYLLLMSKGMSFEVAALSSVFMVTILGLILQPVPGEQVVFLGVVVVGVLGVIPMDRLLSGYSDSVVWLILSVILLSRSVIKTGLGRRLAYLLVRALGKKTLNLGYSLVMTDAMLGAVMPSNGARCGGILFPIVKSLAEAYGSAPGPTAKRLGAFLMALVYQGDVIVCATFLTGQISNFLIVKLIAQMTQIQINYGTWLLMSSVPALLSFIFVPILIYKICPPEVKETPQSAELAERELEKLGPLKLKSKETMTILIFAFMVFMWMTEMWHHIHFTLVAMLGLSLALITRVLDWNDVISEKSAWNVFVWYGGLMMLANQLGHLGITKALAESAGQLIQGQHWSIALSFLVIVYFLAHYGFASLSAHVTALFMPFLAVILSTGAPPWVSVLLLAFGSNLCAGLTHYGTTPAPIYFGAGYVSQSQWWKIGFIVSVFNLSIWSVAGSIWWKILGVW